MPMIAPPLVLKSGDRERMEAVLRASSAPVSLVMRVRIVLLVSEGLANAEIARRVGVSGLVGCPACLGPPPGKV